MQYVYALVLVFMHLHCAVSVKYTQFAHLFKANFLLLSMIFGVCVLFGIYLFWYDFVVSTETGNTETHKNPSKRTYTRRLNCSRLNIIPLSAPLQ